MADDDLDKLLSDIDADSDYSKSRDESMRFKKKIARKSNSHVEEEVEGLTTDEAFSQRMQSIPVDKDIGVFQNGVVNAIINHTVLTQKFRRLIMETDINDEVRQVVQKYKYTFIRYIENIEKIYDEYTINLDSDVISKKARKDFSIFFQGFEEENKINFLELKELFLRLREFNSRTKKEWDELSKSISVINLVAEGKILYQDLNNTISDAIGFTRITDRFLERLSRVLSIPEDDFDVLERDIDNKIIYHGSYGYGFNGLFEESRPEKEPVGRRSIDDIMMDIREDTSVQIGSDEYIEKEVPSATDFQEAPQQEKGGLIEKDGRFPVNYTVRGTTSWNTREPYLLRVDNEKFLKEQEDLGISFYFVTPDEKGPLHEGTVKRAMIRFLSDRTLIIKDKYEEFIFKTIILLVQDLISFFEFDGEPQNLFIYHLGPATMYKQIIALFQSERFGMCYKYMPGNKVVRFMPGESIKIQILGWYEENINSLNLDFDKVQYFDEVRRTIAGKYKQETEKHTKQLDDLIAKLQLDKNRNFNRDEFFKSKWNEWFGITRIITYNRFIERTIFK